MRIDQKGNVGIGFTTLDMNPKINSKLQVNRNIVISSSLFTDDNPGPNLIFKGLKNPSSKQLPHFRLLQVKSQDSNVSGAFEIRAMRSEPAEVMPLNSGDTGIPGGFVPFHIRTYGTSNIPSPDTSDGTSFQSIPHHGANFGFNNVNPDGFNVNVQQSTFGRSAAVNRMNFRGDTQFRFEGQQYFFEQLGGDTGQFGG